MNPIVANQIDFFISNLPDKPVFRRFLLELKHSQESELFQLEQEYLSLVQERRVALINYIRSSVGNERHVHDTLEQMHGRTQAELDAFLKIRVHEGWQAGQVHKQIEAMRSAGFPSALLELESGGNVK